MDKETFREKWTQEHGEDPDKWPLPKGQPMAWKEWVDELTAEAVRRNFDPVYIALFGDFEVWGHYWLEGKNPFETADALATHPEIFL